MQSSSLVVIFSLLLLNTVEFSTLEKLQGLCQNHCSRNCTATKYRKEILDEIQAWVHFGKRLSVFLTALALCGAEYSPGIDVDGTWGWCFEMCRVSLHQHARI